MKFLIPFTICLFLSLFNINFSLAQENTPALGRPISNSEISTLIDSLNLALNKYYVFPEKASLMLDYINSQHKNGAYNQIFDTGKLASQLHKDLQQIHKDPHLYIFYNPQTAADLERQNSSNNNNKQARERGLAQVRKNNFGFKKPIILKGNIGYVRFDEFLGFIQEAKPKMASTFKSLSNTIALIIDLRYNQGGSPEMVNQIESYFFKEKTRMNDIIDRWHNTTYELYAEPEKADGITLSMPLYILTSKQTFSAAEDFCYAMQNIKRAKIVGETTAGGAHPAVPISLKQGFVIEIPFARSYNNITKTDWEGTGVIPDVPINAKQAFTRAKSLANEELLKIEIEKK